MPGVQCNGAAYPGSFFVQILKEARRKGRGREGMALPAASFMRALAPFALGHRGLGANEFAVEQGLKQRLQGALDPREPQLDDALLD